MVEFVCDFNKPERGGFMNSFDLPLLQGKASPQLGVPKNMSTEAMLLYAAWLHGVKSDDTVHRLALFSFIQSHVANKSDESLQTVIEKSAFWKGVGKGYYAFTSAGAKEVNSKFGLNSRPAKFGYEYSFLRQYMGREIKIIINVNNRKLTPFIDGRQITGVETNRILTGLSLNPLL
jgi:hypothetical protein